MSFEAKVDGVPPSTLLPKFHTSLQNFINSSNSYSIVHAIPSKRKSQSSPELLHVLDSSFNPPTAAHRDIALSSLRVHLSSNQQRLILLLATQNADKAAKPAAYEQRLVMMALLAEDILDKLRHPGKSENAVPTEQLAIDIALTKQPYFHDKARSIEESQLYVDASASSPQPQQIHLLGYDSLIRLLNTKYYPPAHNLSPLAPLFAKHKIRVTKRADIGGEQEEYVRKLERGEREDEGGKREWAERIQLVDGEKEGDTVSSTRVREGLKKGDWKDIGNMLSSRMGYWVAREGLYKEED